MKTIQAYRYALDLTPGQEICFDLVGNRRLWRIRGTVAKGTEKVETAAGTFEAVRLEEWIGPTRVSASFPTPLSSSANESQSAGDTARRM